MNLPDYLMTKKRSSINIEDINLDDRRFYIPEFAYPGDLAESISRIGIINPPLLIETSGILVCILGRRRISAAKSINLKEVVCQVLYDQISEPNAFRLAFWDNIAHRNLSTALKAFLVRRILELFDRQTAIEEFWSSLNIDPIGPKIERLRKIGSLELQVLQNLADGLIHEKTAYLFSDMTAEQRFLFMDIAQNLKLNGNKIAEVVSILDDLAKFHSRDLVAYLQAPDLVALVNDRSLDCKQKAEKLRSYCFRLKYPDVYEKQIVFNDWVQSLGKQDNISIKPHQSYETPGCCLEMKIRSFEEAQQILSQIKLSATNGNSEESS
jgi:hypothetical protein